MLNEAELILLIVEGEGERVDFKRELDLSTAEGKSELVKDIIALANSAPNGGYLLVGVDDDDKSIVGVNKIEEERIQEIAHTYINPSVRLRCALVPIHWPEQAYLGVIEVKATRRPYKIARSIGSFKQNDVFVRHGSIILKASPEEIIEMSSESPPPPTYGEKKPTREDIIQALKELEVEGIQPSRKALLERKGINGYQIVKLIPEGLTELKLKLGITITPQERPRSDDDLLKKIDEVVSHLKGIPTWAQLRRETRITDKVFIKRFGNKGISEVFRHYRKWLEEHHPESENIRLVDAYLARRSR